MKTVPCRGCGKQIVFARIVNPDGSDGAMVPLDPRAAVYEFRHLDYSEAAQASLTFRYEVVRSPADHARGGLPAMVSHFATCPKANEFSRRSTSKGEAHGHK